MKIQSTTRRFKDGVAFAGEQAIEVAWESTGHLSVRLLDASGTVPLGETAVAVDIPGEGRVELTTDQEGRIFFPDVPFQDYELTVGEARVHAPAVAGRRQVHERHTPEIVFLFPHILVRGGDGQPLARTAVVLRGDGTELALTTDDHGRLAHDEPLPAGEYVVRVGEAEVAVVLPSRPGVFAIAQLPRP